MLLILLILPFYSTIVSSLDLPNGLGEIIRINREETKTSSPPPKPRIQNRQINEQDVNFTVVQTLVCTNETDLYAMLYSICHQLPLCRELYYLEDGLGSRRDFAKFQHQLSLVALFNSHPTQSTSRLFVRHIWPSKWLPYYLVQYNSSAPSCSHSVALQNVVATSEDRAFVYAASNMMMTYKQYMSNEHYCNDHNERLLFDTTDGSFHCECKSGKLCNNSEATYNSMLIFMGIAILLALLLLIFVSVYNTLHYSRLMDGTK